MMSPGIRRVLAAGGGALAALLAWELVLHPFARQLRAPPWPNPACDSVRSPVVATRQFEEGIALARYTACGARLTGSDPLPGAEYVVLLGDSHVAAREVDDDETTGARLESFARAQGRPLNVRQYGWRGAAPPLYVVQAPAVLRRWHPAEVVVLLSEDDLGADLLDGMPPLLRYSSDSQLVLDGGEAVVRDVPAPRLLAVGSLVERRWTMILARSPAFVRALAGPVDLDVDEHADDRLVPGVPSAVARLLHDAYGDRLLLVYVADVRVTGGDTATTKESLLLRACAEVGTRCVSTREAMLDARRRGVIARGSPTTVLGIGHLNAEGHDLVAREIWRALQ